MNIDLTQMVLKNEPFIDNLRFINIYSYLVGYKISLVLTTLIEQKHFNLD
jgi:hypothetical protein